MFRNDEDDRKFLQRELSDFLEKIEDRWRDENAVQEAQNEASELRADVKRLEAELAKIQPPSEYQLKQWEDGKAALKKLEDVRKQAYNEGYAAAYVEVTNRMRTVNIQQGQGNY